MHMTDTEYAIWLRQRDPTAAGPDERETPFMQRVIATARRLGWQVYHTYDSRKSAAGFPDLCLVRPGEAILAECKQNREKPTQAQQVWLQLFASVPGVEACVWRPRDEPAILARLAQPQRFQKEMPRMALGNGLYDRWTIHPLLDGAPELGCNLGDATPAAGAPCTCPACQHYHTAPDRQCTCRPGVKGDCPADKAWRATHYMHNGGPQHG